MMRLYIQILVLVLIGKINVLAQTVPVPDPNFLNFLNLKYPQVVFRGNIVISEAAKVRGGIVCNGQNIKNVEGIQYFTGISSLNLYNNVIDSIPSIANLTELSSLNVALNNLKKLPILNNQTKLKELIAYKNKITTLPDLNNNVLLEQLQVYDNQITTLPDFNKLHNLVYIDVVNNALTSLPELRQCKRLELLLCTRNQITELPDLDSLHKIKTIDLSYNMITLFPDLKGNQNLELLHLNNNQLITIPELPPLPNLKKMWLYNNYFTFNAFDRIRSFANYKDVFIVNPQLKTGQTQHVVAKRSEPVFLKSDIDIGVEGVYYEWYKDGILISTVSNYEFRIDKANFSDSGAYHCKIKSRFFPSLILESDVYRLLINDCVDLGSLSTVIYSMSCEGSGAFILKGAEKYDYSYEIKSVYGGRIHTSTTGVFKGLDEPQYTLTIITKQGCECIYPKEIVIPTTECASTLITPNDDGDKDSHFFPQKGSVSIFNKRGELIKSITIPGQWDASGPEGRVVQGLYIADINNGEEIVKISVVY